MGPGNHPGPSRRPGVTMRRVLICSGVLGGGTALVFALAALTATLFPHGTHRPDASGGGWRRRRMPMDGTTRCPMPDGGAGVFGPMALPVDAGVTRASPDARRLLVVVGVLGRRHRARVRRGGAHRDAVPQRHDRPDAAWNGGWRVDRRGGWGVRRAACPSRCRCRATASSPPDVSDDGTSSRTSSSALPGDAVGGERDPSAAPVPLPAVPERGPARRTARERGRPADHPILSRPCASSPDSSTATIASWAGSSR